MTDNKKLGLLDHHTVCTPGNRSTLLPTMYTRTYMCKCMYIHVHIHLYAHAYTINTCMCICTYI